jgi:GPH family glycoside/pentoside/hexuronide:cation symporter
MTGAAATVPARAAHLPAYAVFAGLLASAGLPIYIHAPKFYVDQYGVSLAALGAVLFALRLVDVVQDPLLGWLSERWAGWRGGGVALGAGLMAVSMLGLFAVTPPVAPLVWFGLTLTGLFTGFSFLTINFYAQGVAKAAQLGAGGHIRVAAWRETGALLGVCLAAVAPTVAMALTGAPFAAFAAGFTAVAVLAVVLMHSEWRGAAMPGEAGFRAVLSDPVARRLLIVALVNATPVAVTSTLFLFFVESRLAAPGWEGPLLLLFFLAAAASAPAWSRAADRFGAKRVLIAGMVLSILSFGVAAALGAGDLALFAAVCLASGAALGADMTLLPAIFAGRLAEVAPGAGQGFGLWSFVSKFTLAFAAAVLLPALEASGFSAGPGNPPEALAMLTILYALVPCALKLVAIALLAATPLKEA